MIKPRDKDRLDIESEMRITDYRLVLFLRENKLHYFFLNNSRIERFFVEDINSYKVGDIILSRVNHINKGLSGCFVSLDISTNAYLPFEKNVIPILVNREYKDSLKEGDEVFVKIKKEANGVKKILASAKFNSQELEIINKYKNTTTKYKKLISGSSYLDVLREDYGDFKIIATDDITYDYISNLNIINDNNLIRYKEDINPQALYGLRHSFEEISERKVWLKSGGYIVIDKTEALTAIDVNSGKCDLKDKNTSILKVNLEAAKEIAYQLKARNLSGMILVDFINFDKGVDDTILINAVREELKYAGNGAKLEDVTKLGLFEITRTKKRPDIYEIIPKMDKTILM